MRRSAARYSALCVGQSESASDWTAFESGNRRAPSAAIRCALSASPPSRKNSRYSAQAAASRVYPDARRALRAAAAAAPAHLAAALPHSSKMPLNSPSHSSKLGMCSWITSASWRYIRSASIGLPLSSSSRASSSTGDRSRFISPYDSASKSPGTCESSMALSNSSKTRGR